MWRRKTGHELKNSNIQHFLASYEFFRAPIRTGCQAASQLVLYDQPTGEKIRHD